MDTLDLLRLLLQRVSHLLHCTPSRRIPFRAVRDSEIEALKKDNCNTGASDIGYVLSRAMPNTVPLYRIAFDDKLFTYTTDASAPTHFRNRGSLYSIAVLGYLYREWPCAASMGSSSVTQVVTEPMMAIWSVKDMCPLHQVLSYSPTRSSVAYLPTTNGHDGLFSARYKSMLTSLPSVKPAARSASATAFSKFQRSAVKCNGVSTHPWKISGMSLAQFMMKAKSGQSRVKIAINRVSSTTARGETKIVQPKRHHFIGSYRLGTLRQSPIHVKRDHFSMVFESQGFMGIKVTPGNWFDRALIRMHKAELTRLGFFGPKGKLPLTPRIIWVAFKPVVTFTLKTSEISKLVSAFSSPSTAAISIGGIRFSSQSVNGALDANSGTDRVPDTVTLSDSVEIESKTTTAQDDAVLESVFSSILGNTEIVDRNDNAKKDSTKSDNIFAFLRLKRLQKDRVTVKQQKDTVQTANFQSNSNDAVIVGITSENTESFGSAFNW